MARTIEQVSKDIKAAFVNNNTLKGLYGFQFTGGDGAEFFDANFSKVSIEARLIFVIASCVASVENMFDWFKRDITQMVENERYGYAGWYEKTAKLFRFGVGISTDYSPEGSFAENSLYPDSGLTAEEIAELQIVKHAFAAENATGVVVTVKVAAENAGNITQLTTAQLAALTSYLNRIKPAGIPLRIVNEPAEILHINLKVWYDPLVLNANGESIAAAKKTVETAVKSYLNSIEFAGEFVVMRMIDAAQQAEGAVVASFVSATATAGSVTINITERYTPSSGYMKLAATNGLNVEYLIEK